MWQVGPVESGCHEQSVGANFYIMVGVLDYTYMHVATTETEHALPRIVQGTNKSYDR